MRKFFGGRPLGCNERILDSMLNLHEEIKNISNNYLVNIKTKQC